MLTVEEAQQRILAELRPLGPERLPLADAAGRVGYADVHAARALPAFSNASMDGYALRAVDTTHQPCRLRVVDTIAAGRGDATPLPSGAAMRIFTGAPVPAGADAVVMQEHTHLDGPWV